MSGANQFTSGTGPLAGQSTVNVQQMSDLVAAVTNSVRALANIAQLLSASIGATGFSMPVQLASYTVANLPAITLGSVGQIAFATNGRNTGESGSAGTGCTVQVQNKGGTATWCAIWSGAVITS